MAYPTASSADDLKTRRKAAAAESTRWLTGRRPSVADTLRQLADVATEDARDGYGTGGEVALLEAEVAELLGKPAAVFMPTGIAAQQSVLRVFADRAGTQRVAVHGLSHLLVHELNALEELHHLRIERLTSERRQPRPDELAAIPGRLAAVALELPLRDAGFVLPTWDELVIFAEACAQRGVPLHLDGARLWESTPYLGHSLAEVAALASTVYVSFYKGLGGLSGAALAGPEDVVAEVRRWQRRLGANPYTLFPYAVSARDGLRRVLPRMGELHDRAVELAAELDRTGFRVFPAPPHTNSFRVYAPRPAEEIELAAVRRMEATRESLVHSWLPADVPGWSWVELVVTPDTLAWRVDEVVKGFGDLLAD
ncbi:aromatic amino acid beta-eliminating lyase/threonine aldolase [Kribbella flavida DSM 17836]|uniref:Aromatic amino acid beta-eliminating lyase/threonine aldolase n=1 Tax=Kribbella flavida (strain DSM 17836 / JCM 10339 / NBRC 14399) TaxID=479435 RepID=D2Q0L6_KRIFD|nr:beta-eliminating lyase-related protein [Kribbella flavida]ADB33816.1 aromatic amino acid beta-eliminating lyase/threonine aldolase [Kribbella flavida DSM 17836]